MSGLTVPHKVAPSESGQRVRRGNTFGKEAHSQGQEELCEGLTSLAAITLF